MKDIIERLEEAEIGDREIDVAIAQAIGWQYVRNCDVGSPHLWGWHGMSPDGRTGPIPAYSTSIDAALALVERMLPDANCWGFDKVPKDVTAYVSRINVNEGHWYFEGVHKSAQVALLLALFCALQAKEGE